MLQLRIIIIIGGAFDFYLGLSNELNTYLHIVGTVAFYISII